MDKNQDKIDQLHERLDALAAKQASVFQEIDALRTEIQRLNLPSDDELPVIINQQNIRETVFREAELTVSDNADEQLLQPEPAIHENIYAGSEKEIQASSTEVDIKSPKIKSDIEKFIGENLISKIGIAITILGVGIGAKYAIDHDLISPWTRIILGYLVGLGLMGFAIYLKKQYENFSAVLLSGAMAIMYFITFAAFSFYSLIPLLLTFILMVLFTVFTVMAAITYGKQVIAHIGLVGAYAVPFLLGDESGSISVLYGYIAIINIGILVISFNRYWKPLFYSSFILTWLIFVTWFYPSYEAHKHFVISLAFISIFFTTFYVIFLAYKLLKKEKFEIEDILLLLGNSTVFYGLGYTILRSDQTGEEYLGLFTLGNAAIHFVVSALIYRKKATDPNLLYFVIGLVLVFITIAIPVQLDGKWVTMLWAGEVAVMFWIGRTKSVSVYEMLSYPLMFLALYSLLHDWLTVYNVYDPRHPDTRIPLLFNINFLTSVIFIASFIFINFLNNRKQYLSPLSSKKMLVDIMNFAMPSILLMAVYIAFIMEITTFWNQRYIDSMVTLDKNLTVPKHFWNENIHRYITISILNYSLLFLTVLSFVNILKIKNSLLATINLAMNAIAIGLFLTVGLFAIGELRESYLSQDLSDYFYRGTFTIGVRYVSFLFVAGILFSISNYIKNDFHALDLKTEYDFLLHITILTLVSNELINWLDLFRSEESYKLGLSILFGIYALLLIVLGIWKKKKHLRIGAIVLFAGTLVKLFSYDLTDLNTISKTIVFVSLGVLLLIISFLYNKYKKLIFDQD